MSSVVPGFTTGPVTVSVPATSANLGPGYDCLGLALGLRDSLTAEVADSGLDVDLDGEGAGSLPRDERHLVVRAMRATFDTLGAGQPGLRLRCRNVIPHSRGLGSSSAAIVGGVVLARALVVDGEHRMTDADALRLANALEGHPDNVAPALLGGLVVSGQDAGTEGVPVWAASVPVLGGLSVVVFVPPTGVLTEVARRLLPDHVSHADAAANTGRAALLVAALGTDEGLLLRATEDFLHQGYRRSAMPESLDLMERLRAAGVPATISGAGPTVLAFAGEAAGLSAPSSLSSNCPSGWTSMALDIDPRGAIRV